MAKKKKRVELRKNRTKPPREKGWKRGFESGDAGDASVSSERVRAKRDLSPKRTIATSEDADQVMPDVDPAVHLPGRVIVCYGLDNLVQTDDGRRFRCKVRR